MYMLWCVVCAGCLTPVARRTDVALSQQCNYGQVLAGCQAQHACTCDMNKCTCFGCLVHGHPFGMHVIEQLWAVRHGRLWKPFRIEAPHLRFCV